MEQVFESRRISFVRVSEQLVPDYLIMINDTENVGRYFAGQKEPYTVEQEIDWVRKTLEENAEVFSMIEKSSGEFIGNIELREELGIALVKKEEAEDQGGTC